MNFTVKSSYLLLLLLIPTMAWTQLTDDFSDGDFTNSPIWSGDDMEFEVDSELRLHLIGPEESNESHLSTPSIAINNAQWDVTLMMDFNPSSSNRSYVYLVSDSPDLEGDLNGYFVMIGNSADEVSLYRQNGSSTTKIIDGIDGLLDIDPVNISIRVTRDETGNWELLRDLDNSGTYISEGLVFDDTHDNSAFFGLLCDYSSTRHDLFYFDDIEVTGSGTIDEIPPALESIIVLDSQSLQLEFNEALDVASAQDVSNYTWLPFTNPNSAMLSGQTVTLTFASDFPDNELQMLQVESVADLASNTMNTVIDDFIYYILGVGSVGDIVINELLADPNPVIGLPEEEFIELFNASDSAFDLLDWNLQDTGSDEILGSFILGPGAYVIICDDSNEAAFSSFGDVLSVPSLSALTNGGDSLALINPDGVSIDVVTYTSDWLGGSPFIDGGYSLERKNPYLSCGNSFSNWSASSDPAGGTPGEQNSNFIESDDIAPTLSAFAVLDTESILLTFSEGMDEMSLLQGSYTLTPDATVTPMIGGDNGSVILNIDPPLVPGQPYALTIADVLDCSGNSILATEVPFFVPEEPEPGDVVINEIMADPSEPVGLPEVEYVELFNASDKIFDLSGWNLLNSNSDNDLSSFILQPGGYVILCDLEDADALSSYGDVLGISSFSSLTNGQDDLQLRDLEGELLDELVYSSDWYGDSGFSDGGYSLERKNPFTPCGSLAPNWSASSDLSGGTPGTENSNFISEDVIIPTVTAISVEDVSTINIGFSEGMDELSLFLGQYVLTPSANLVAESSGAIDTLTIAVDPPMILGDSYTLSISGPEDCSGLLLSDTTITFYVPEDPEIGDVIINEIMADPSEPFILPEVEYVELYNNSDKIFQLQGWNFLNGTSDNFLGPHIMLPGTYVILCDSEDEALLESYGDVLAVEDFSSLGNSADELALLDLDGELLDAVSYTSDWYQSDIKDDGGYALELINPELPCSWAANWIGSIANERGTPGAMNSVYDLSPDVISPISCSATPLGSGQQIEIVFSEPLESESVDPQNFVFSPDIPVLAAISNNEKVLLILDGPIDEEVIYSIDISDVTDCSDNPIISNSEVLTGLPLTVDEGDLLINEVLYDPRTGGVDFVELYNNSDKTISLKNWKMANREGGVLEVAEPISEEDILIFPGEFKVLTENKPNIALNYPLGVPKNYIEIDDLPSYPDDEGYVVLVSPNDGIFDEFYYNDDYQFALIDITDGVSLERVDYNRLTNDPTNWHSAAERVGYATPGYENSQLQPANVSSAAFTLEPDVFSPDNDGFQDLLNISYVLDNPGSVANISIFDRDGRLMRLLARNQLLATEGTISWDGITDEGSKARIGVYIILIEIFDLEGNTSSTKKSCVLGGRL